MGWSMLLKSILMMALKKQVTQKVRHLSREEIYSNALYVPLVCFFVTAPTFFMSLSLITLMAVGIAQFFPNYFFPTDFALVMAGFTLGMSAVTFLIYRIGLGKILIKDKTMDTLSVLNLEDKFAGVFAPIRNQLQDEHNMYKQSFYERKN